MISELRIACIGAGVIGRSWAVAFAAGGANVRVFDPSKTVIDRARGFAAEALSRLRTFGRCDDPDAALDRIRFFDVLETAVAGTYYVQESIAENVADKEGLFEQLDGCAPSSAILASSSSTLPASSFMSNLDGCARCIVVHPVNPPHIIPAVEVCPAHFTSRTTIGRTVKLLESIGHVPVVLKKEIPGLLINRLQLALIGEALHLVSEGYCSASDLDRAVKYGLGLRWALLGPFEAGHLNADGGYYEYMNKFEPAVKQLIGQLQVDYDWSEADYRKIADELSSSVKVEDIPKKQAERDHRLLSLIQTMQRIEPK